MYSLNAHECAVKNAMREKLLADSDAWLAGSRDIVVTIPAPPKAAIEKKEQPLNLKLGKKVGRPKKSVIIR